MNEVEDHQSKFTNWNDHVHNQAQYENEINWGRDIGSEAITKCTTPDGFLINQTLVVSLCQWDFVCTISGLMRQSRTNRGHAFAYRPFFFHSNCAKLNESFCIVSIVVPLPESKTLRFLSTAGWYGGLRYIPNWYQTHAGKYEPSSLNQKYVQFKTALQAYDVDKLLAVFQFLKKCIEKFFGVITVIEGLLYILYTLPHQSV